MNITRTKRSKADTCRNITSRIYSDDCVSLMSFGKINNLLNRFIPYSFYQMNIYFIRTKTIFMTSEVVYLKAILFVEYLRKISVSLSIRRKYYCEMYI